MFNVVDRDGNEITIYGVLETNIGLKGVVYDLDSRKWKTVYLDYYMPVEAADEFRTNPRIQLRNFDSMSRLDDCDEFYDRGVIEES